VTLLLLGILPIGLYLLGRPPICVCGDVKLWQYDGFSPQFSQHLADWYTFTHVLHGILFYGMVSWAFPDRSRSTRLALAVGLEVGWEWVENTEFVIEYYRQNTMAVKFYGDTIVNSFVDVLAMIVGFEWYRQLSVVRSVSLFVAVECLTLFAIRDSFLLNVLMFVYPFEFIKSWQMTGL
jgi:hypothetical protein